MAATRAIRGLGEIALRVADLDRMQGFYQEVIGLELLRRFLCWPRRLSVWRYAALA